MKLQMYRSLYSKRNKFLYYIVFKKVKANKYNPNNNFNVLFLRLNLPINNVLTINIGG